jgi:hyperosmotically inducible protein
MRKNNRVRPRSVSLIVLSLLLAQASGSCVFAATPAKGQVSRDSAHFEAWLTKEVHHELVMLPWVSIFDNLAYKVDGAKVTLYGQVVQPVLKSDAENAVKHIEGVEAVDNQIEVLPPSPMDDRIRRAEFHAIYDYPALERYQMGALPSIHIVVKSGHVTLEGVVSTQADKDVAGLRANTVPDVFSVTNNLRVENAK